MQSPISISQVNFLINKTLGSFPHTECESCECFLGFIAQLELDAEDAGKIVLQTHKLDKQGVHACLGCNPCPPGELYADYLREKRKTRLKG